APGSADPLGDVLITVTLVDASEGADGAELGQATAGPFSRLRPPRDFALTFDPAAITSDGTYVLEARMEDSASGALLGTEAEQVPVITGGNPVEGITITIVDIAE
ncbi:MAG: YbaY family lipoprotein, partial [Chloroflexota bacterium]